MTVKKNVLYKVLSCDAAGVTLQSINKAAVFHLTWKELLLQEYLCSIKNEQLFFLGTYYAHNLRNMNMNTALAHDYENKHMSKVILSITKSNVYLLMDVLSKKLETLSTKFILSNIDILDDFTSMQAFFIGIQTGVIYDKFNIKNLE